MKYKWYIWKYKWYFITQKSNVVAETLRKVTINERSSNSKVKNDALESTTELEVAGV